MEIISQIQDLLDRYKKGDPKVLRDGEKLIDLFPSPFKTLLYVSLTNFALLVNDLKKAKSYIQAAREHFNEESQYIDEASLVLGENLLHFYSGELKLTLENLEKIGMRDHHQIQFVKAECLYWRGHFSRAMEEYTRAFTMCEGDENLQEDAQLCLFGKARCHFRLGELQKAEEYLSALAQRQGIPMNDETEESSILALAELAKVYAIQGKIDEAMDIFDKELLPSEFTHRYRQSNALTSLGIAHFFAGNFKDAILYLTRVAEFETRQFDKLEAFLYLGEAESSLGNSKSSKKWYQIVSSFPEVFLAAGIEEKISGLDAGEESPKKEESTLEKRCPGEALEKEEEKPSADLSIERTSENVFSDLPLVALLIGIDMIEYERMKKQA